MIKPNFRKFNKFAACTSSPFEHLIPFDIRKETILKIKQECLDEYGVDLTTECPKRMTCIKKTCIGRPLPYKSKTALQYLKKLEETQNIVNEELFIETDCTACPMLINCSSICPQINDYINRSNIKEPLISYRAKIDDLEIETIEESRDVNLDFLTIPWDCLSEIRKNVVKMYIYEQLDFQHIANKLNLNNQARAKLEFYYALTTLSEYGIMRKFLAENETILTPKQLAYLSSYYKNNMKLDKIAKKYKVTKQTVQQTIKKVIKDYNIKWQTFVKKEGKKVIYNVAEVLR